MVFQYEEDKTLDAKEKKGQGLLVESFEDKQALYMQNHIPEIYSPMRVDSKDWIAKQQMEKQNRYEETKKQSYNELKLKMRDMMVNQQTEVN